MLKSGLYNGQPRPRPVKNQLTLDEDARDPFFNQVDFLIVGNEGHDTATITDQSNSSRSINLLGSPDNTSAFKFSGDGSYYFDNDEGISVAQGSAWDFGLNPFTIEARHYLLHDPAISGTFVTFAPTSGEPNTFHLESKRLSGIEFGWNGGVISVAFDPFFRWFHWAVTGDGTTVRLWLEGELYFETAQIAIAFPDGFAIWGTDNARTAAAASWLDFARVTPNICRYKDRFTPPKAIPTR